MEEYHNLKIAKPHARLPQILGLTASPVFNPANAEENFQILEANMDATIITVKDAAPEADGYFMKPLERPLFYADTGHQMPETDFQVDLEDLEIWDHVKEDKVRRRIENIKSVSLSLILQTHGQLVA
jgi:hypothetical protein